MSQENVEIVRQAIVAYGRRDLDALRLFAHPNAELDWSASSSSLARIYRGFDDAVHFYREYYEIFESTVVEPEEFIETGDLVIVPNTAYQRGRDGITTSARSTLVFAVHNQRITRICLYQETGEALKAVGLAEEPPV